jgi:tetratricopeptide (TPR) repeat protein
MAIKTEANKWNQNGIDYDDSGKYDEAIKCYDKAIKIDPNHFWAWNNKGVALSKLEKDDDAIKCFDRAIKIDRNYINAWINKGISHVNLENFDEALKCYDKAIEIDPNDSLTLVSKGNVFYLLENYTEAFKSFDKAIQKDPNYVYAWISKGLVLQSLKNYIEAISCFDTVIEKDPNYINAWIYKGDILYVIGNFSEAESCLETAFKLDPKNIITIENLLHIYSSIKHEYDKALQLAQVLLEIKPDFMAKANMAESLILVGKYEEGRKYSLQALSETQNAFEKCITRLFILSSYLLDDDEANGRKEYTKFFEFYKNLDKDFKIEEELWDFRGLINVISKSDTNLPTKFLLHTIIDLIQGNIERQKLSFFSEADSM